jgi:CHAT domain-containing protein
MMKYWRYLGYFLLGLGLTAIVLFSQVEAGKVRVPASNDIVAKATNIDRQRDRARLLTKKGHEQLDRGQAATALETWQEALKIYRQLHHQEGISGSLINESLALLALGFYPRACHTLVEALQLEDWLCQSPLLNQTPVKELEKSLKEVVGEQLNPSLVVTGLQNLGDVLRLMGKPTESEIVLKQALAAAKRLVPTPNTDAIKLSLANTQRTLYNQAQNNYRTTAEPIAGQMALKTAQTKARTALNLYQNIAERAGERQNNAALQAQINRLSLLLELEHRSPKNLPEVARAQIHSSVKQLIFAQFSQLPVIESIYARLNFANSLVQISQNVKLNQLLFTQQKKPLPIALQFAQAALKQAQSLSHSRAESYALGTLGDIYNHLGQTERSQQYLEAALAKAQSVQAWDIAYQWQQKLGRLYQTTVSLDRAIETYAAAVDSLDEIRGNLLAVNPDIQFGFKEKVEPIYREYMRLLLSEKQPNLERAIQTNERLQLAELENYLGGGKLDLVSLNELENVSDSPAVIHVINLGDSVETIVRSIDGSFHRHTANLEAVKRNADNLLFNLQDKRFVYTDERLIRSYSQSLYDLLIAPIKTYLPHSGTLIFVLDSSWQNLPMALLHDGQNYLLKQYSISVALGSQLRQPQALQKEQLKALIAGLSEKSPSFAAPNAPPNLTPLPEVAEEVADVKANTTAAVELLNEQFTSDRFRQQIDSTDFPVIHITTHGQFSSDPQQTVILAWDRAINVRELNGLLQNRAQSKSTSLELLVLSACQTAKGDKRSALGIAGVAAQAGARSTIATLWLVDATSNAQLMGEFYSGLKNGLDKAEALRQAQLTLLSNPKYQHPYYWSPFILVGSWL